MCRHKPNILFFLLIATGLNLWAQAPAVSGRVFDPHGRAIQGATVHLSIHPENEQRQPIEVARVVSGDLGQYQFEGLIPGRYTVQAESAEFVSVSELVTIQVGMAAVADLQFRDLISQRESIVIHGKSIEPSIDLRNSEVFNRTLFTRDDQIFQQMNAGINAGQHEGGGKSLEIRRFGFNLDHGGTNGGLKVLMDNVSQNQGTQGHGQGYLGALKAVSPELIQDVTVVNGPFSAEYGDFSGLGVVHIRQRESMPDEFTARLSGGNFDTGRGFLAWSPTASKTDSYIAYDGSYTNGPFLNSGRYRRDNVNANLTRRLDDSRKVGLRFIFGRNNFYSSGQLPVDLIDSGELDRFGFIDPTEGGRAKLGTLAGYYSKVFSDGSTLKVDGFLGRSLFDLYSNFTYYLHDPVNGDAFQQHDSRLQEGGNAQWMRVHRLGGLSANLIAGGNFHDNQINVGLYPRQGRAPTGISTRALARVTNLAGYLHENVVLLRGKLLLGGGLRFDEFRYGVTDVVIPEQSGVQYGGRWQGKGSVAFTPSRAIPLTFHANYGRGINSIDARGVIQRPDQPRIATTDFYQAGTSSNFGHVSIGTDAFFIRHSNEQVYIPDDGSFEFKGATNAYGFEAKASVEITRHISLNGGVTKVSNAYYLGGLQRVYVDSAPHFVANAALTLAAYHGWSGSLRMRAINHYRLNGENPTVMATGHTVFDLGLAKQLSRVVELNLSVDNLTNRDYYETQNYFESRTSPTAPVLARIHATPAYPLTAIAGVTLRFGGK
ncbi:MAG: TonB-dependent receptor [Bryobacteraceae bacterium]